MFYILWVTYKCNVLQEGRILLFHLYKAESSFAKYNIVTAIKHFIPQMDEKSKSLSWIKELLFSSRFINLSSNRK